MKQPETFTSPIGPLMTRYLALKRALGRRAVSTAYILRYLDRFLVLCHAADLTRETFTAWGESMASLRATTRRARLRTVYHFCLFRRREDPHTFVPDLPLGRDGFQHRANFVPFQIVDGAGRSALDGYGQKALGLFHLLGIARREEARERMNGGQAGVAGGDTVFPFRFQMIQKREDIFSPQVLELQVGHPTAMTRGEKAQKEHERIAVTRYRPRAEPTGEGRCWAKKARRAVANFVGEDGVRIASAIGRCCSPCSTAPACRTARSPGEQSATGPTHLRSPPR